MTTPSERLQACLGFTLRYEGGFQDRENDPGNWYNQRLIGTNMGISAPTLAAWIGPDAAASLTAADMRALPQTIVRAIYAARYWNAVRGDDLPAGTDLMLFDFGVLAGPGTSVRMIQIELGRRLGGVTVDGFLGPRTLAAIRASTARAIIPGLATAQAAYLRALRGAADNPGWFTRNEARCKRALAMTQEA